MSGLRIACIGEAMLELRVSSVPGPAEVGVAGDVLNTAIYLRRMLSKEHGVSFVSLVGQDRLSDDIARFIAEQGVDTANLGQIEERLPGIYAITTDNAGERSFHYWRQASAARLQFQEGETLDFTALEAFDVIYLSAISLAILPDEVRQGFLTWLDGFRAEGGRFVFDSNYRPRLWESEEVARATVKACWQRCDIALPSVDDEMALFGDAVETDVLTRFNAYGTCTGALKRGFLGPVSINLDSSAQVFEPAKNVIDTTAAGDGFNGGYLAARLSGSTQDEALMQGHELASRIVGHPGAIIPT